MQGIATIGQAIIMILHLNCYIQFNNNYGAAVVKLIFELYDRDLNIK